MNEIETFDELLGWLERYGVSARLDVGDFDGLCQGNVQGYELMLKRKNKGSAFVAETGGKAVLRSGHMSKDELLKWAVDVCRATWPDMRKGTKENKRGEN